MTQTVICMKWGPRYGADFANRLWGMIRRNTTRDTRLICFTDNAEGVHPDIECRPIPHVDLPESHQMKPWRKISLWNRDLGLEGDILFMDLDLVITGTIDSFFDHAPEETFCVIRNWTQPDKRIGNTSVYRFRVGAHHDVYQRLMDDPEGVTGAHPNSQTYISRTISSMAFWPAEWCVSFKHSLMPRWPLNFIKDVPLPETARVVAFTGKPDPDDAVVGKWPAKGHKKLYKYVRPTPWIAEHWRE